MLIAVICYTGATDSEFVLRILNVMVEKPKTVTIENNGKSGTVSGAGEYVSDELVTVRAAEKQGYEFVGWYSGDTLMSGQKEYGFNVYSDVYLKAHYKKINTGGPSNTGGGAGSDTGEQTNSNSGGVGNQNTMG